MTLIMFQGTTLVILQRYEEAIPNFELALSNGWETGHLWNNKATAYFHLKDYDNTIRYVVPLVSVTILIVIVVVRELWNLNQKTRNFRPISRMR